MMKRFCFYAFLVLLLVSLLSISSCSPSRQAPASPLQKKVLESLAGKQSGYDTDFLIGKQDFVIERHVEDGVIHRMEWTKSGPLFFNAVKLDLTKPHLHLEVEKGQDTLFAGEKVASVAERETYPGHTVVAATNGDFWGKRYTPVGLFVDDGTIFKGPHDHRSVFVVDKEGVPHIIRGGMKIKIQTKRSSLEIDAINPLNPDEDKAILITGRYGDKVSFGKPHDVFLLKRIGSEFLPNQACPVRVEVFLPDTNEVPCTEGGFLLAVKPGASPRFQKNLKQGDEAEILATLEDFDKPVVLALGGIPRIIRDGKITIEYEAEKIRENFSTTRHPRTALGISKDRKTVFLVVVDGRQPSLSIGNSLPELAAYLKKLGAWDAMNLDGGGSSTMWVRGEITSRPSDATGPRTVTNSLLVVSSSNPDDPAHIELGPDELMLPVGAKIQLPPSIYDDHYNPLEGQFPVKWEVSGKIGRMKGQMFLAADQEAGGKITASLDGASDSINVKLVRPKEIEVKPDIILMRTGESSKIAISARGPDDAILYTTAGMIESRVPDGLEWLPNQGLVLGKKKGKFALTLELGGIAREIPVYVDHFKTTVVEGFDDPGEVELSTKNCDDKATNLAVETKIKKEGASALRVNYKLTHGGTSAVYLTMNRPIPGRPHRLGFWVYGDGKEQWLRGFIADKDGDEFIADFTSGTKGVFWEDEWRYVEVQPSTLPPKWSNPTATMDYPLTLKMIYLVQTREAKKSAGSILIDAFSAEYPGD